MYLPLSQTIYSSPAWPTSRLLASSKFLAMQVSFTGYDVEDALVVLHEDPRLRRAVGFQLSCL